ncbi:AAA family ATPase [Gottfriedia acidiceleris]|uniref:AAA family ATPase n=1 Tax=Gottfriedia acidiceleris TaxID=371036 RepID=UPI00339A6B87
MVENIFNTEFGKIKQALQETSEIVLDENYDALLVKSLASSNLLPEKRIGKGKQTHIALTGKDSQDFFPYVDILHYTDNELNPGFSDTSMKSFFVLQVPVTLYQKNIMRLEPNSDFSFDSYGKVLSKPSVKLSRPGASPQIEIGNTSTSDSTFLSFRKLFDERDVLIILKRKNEVKYEGYIIKNYENQRFGLTDVVAFNPQQRGGAIVDYVEVIPSENKDYKELFISWYFEQPEIKASIDTRKKYLKVLDRFANAVNESGLFELTEPFGFWVNPKKVNKEFPQDRIDSMVKALPPNGSFHRADGGGSELSAILGPYRTWVETLTDENNNDQKNDDDLFADELKQEFRQYIYFGAPGTGKSYQLAKDSKLFGNNIERVTFHPNMSYGQFVGVFKPFPTKVPVRDMEGKIVENDEGIVWDEKITYKFIPGSLIKQLVQALLHPKTAYLLIVEELNRANVAASFGDMFQLLDRKSDYFSEYPIAISEDLQHYFDNVYADKENKPYIENMKETLKEGLVFPDNFFIWSTMNSADQGVMPMDTAFKRRWEQKYFSVNEAWDSEEGKQRFAEYSKINLPNGDEISWNVLRRLINDILSDYKNIPEDKLLGPYFISENILRSGNEAVTGSFKTKVLMYLFDDVAKIHRDKLFNGVEKMRYSEVVKKFEKDGLALFNISDEEVVEKEKDEL